MQTQIKELLFRMRLWGVLLLLCGCAATTPVYGQTTGSVSGSVTDPSGAVVGGVQLQLKNLSTNIVLSATSTGSGSYFFSSVQPGNYTLTGTRAGFKIGETSSIVVNAQSTTTIDVHLEMGSDAQTVQVSAFGANSIDLATAQVSTTVGENKIINLPNTSRNVLNFAQLAPGVDFSSQAEGGGQVINITDQSASINGSDEQHNNFYLDGIDNTGGFRNYAMQFPNPDAVQEVQTLSSNAGAELGRQAGGVINVITRSGTNAFHGDGYYFSTPASLTSNSWSNNHYDVVRPPNNQQQYGGVFGGPLIRNKTFFFFSFLRYTNNSVATIDTYRGITPAMLNGDFSALLTDPVTPLQLYNPDTHQPLANNQIPQTMVDPVAKKLFALIPQVPAWGNYYQFTFSQPLENQEWLGKLDHHWSDSNVTTFSVLRVFGQGTYPASQAFNFGQALNKVPDYPGEVDTNGQWTTSLRHTWIATPRLTAEAYVGLNRQSADRGSTDHSTDLADLGAINFPSVQPGARKYYPGFSTRGSDGTQGENGYLSLYVQTDYHVGGKVTYVKRSHSIEFGADSERDQARQFNDEDGLTFTFDGRFSGNGAAEQNQTGTSYADFLMGRSRSFGQNGVLDEKLHDWSNFFFVQDTWKVNPKLTLTPALRYEFYLPYSAANDHATGYIPGHQSTFFPLAPVGLAFPNDTNGVPSGLYPTDYKQYSPRIGAAYDIFGNGKWALRAGFGKYFSHNSGQYFMQNSESTPWQPSASCSAQAFVSNPWLTCLGPTYATPPTPFTIPNGGAYTFPAVINSVVGYSQDWKSPYSLQWNVALEHQLLRGITVEGMYVGNRTRDNTQGIPLNYSQYVDVDGVAPNLNNIVPRRPQQNYGNILLYEPTGEASFQAFQAVANLRYSGLDSTVNYSEQRAYDTVSGGEGNENSTGANPQTANPQNLLGERAENLPHRKFRAYAVWDLPIFRARPQVGMWRLLGGWQIDGDFEASSGGPSDVQLGTDWNFDGLSGDRPNKSGSVNYVKRNLHPNGSNGYIEQYIDVGTPSAATVDGLTAQRGPFAAPTDHAVFGTLKRNAVFGPGQWTLNGALVKNFYITEGRYFQFRADTVNLFNHPTLGSPDLSYQDATFGQIQGKNGQRTIQIGGKFYF